MSSEIQFDEDMMSNTRKTQMAQQSDSSNQPKMVKWLMDRGIAKTPAIAQGILIGTIAAFIILSIILVRSV